jgi:hypothetical protein
VDHLANLTIPTATTWAELTSEDFLRAFAAEVGVTVTDLELGQDGDQSTARMDWEFSTDAPGIPELAKRFLPSRVQLQWAQAWQPLEADRAAGRLDVVLPGRPGATSVGTCLLTADEAGSGSLLRTSTKTSAELPFPIAGRVESLIDKDLVGWIISVQARVLLRRAG